MPDQPSGRQRTGMPFTSQEWVGRAARTGGLPGMRGTLISPAEREFLASLGAAVDRAAG